MRATVMYADGGCPSPLLSAASLVWWIQHVGVNKDVAERLLKYISCCLVTVRRCTLSCLTEWHGMVWPCSPGLALPCRVILCCAVTACAMLCCAMAVLGCCRVVAFSDMTQETLTCILQRRQSGWEDNRDSFILTTWTMSNL